MGPITRHGIRHRLRLSRAQCAFLQMKTKLARVFNDVHQLRMLCIAFYSAGTALCFAGIKESAGLSILLGTYGLWRIYANWPSIQPPAKPEEKGEE